MTDNLQNPFVLQCRQCKYVVGDSFALLDCKDNFLVLGAVECSMQKTKDVCCRKRKWGDGSPYYGLKCSCGVVVGEWGLHFGKDRYCLDKKKLIVYMLGNSKYTGVTLSELAEEVTRLQKFCTYLYKRMSENS